jgi:hypothetical protein
MAKARHVGCPHFLQFVFGSNLNISMPVKAIFLTSLTPKLSDFIKKPSGFQLSLE